ncbi:protein S40-5-like [Rosa sericea]
MAKGRKLTQSRSERFLGSYSSYSHAQESPELAEDDVWSMVETVEERDDNEVDNSQSEWSPRFAAETNGGLAPRGRSRRIPRDDNNVSGGLSLAFVEDSGKTASSPRIVHQFRGHDSVASPRGRHMATSLPVNVPDWSKILRVDSVDSLYEFDDGMDSSNDPEMIPPHEYLAREYTRGATSVFEGVGRTLKGRDMRRVRDAVWSRTGFDG